jgi:hypothetical protein
MAACCLLFFGCNNGDSNNSTTTTPVTSAGSVTVQATSGNLSHSAQLSVTVN